MTLKNTLIVYQAFYPSLKNCRGLKIVDSNKFERYFEWEADSGEFNRINRRLFSDVQVMNQDIAYFLETQNLSDFIVTNLPFRSSEGGNIPSVYRNVRDYGQGDAKLILSFSNLQFSALRKEFKRILGREYRKLEIKGLELL